MFVKICKGVTTAEVEEQFDEYMNNDLADDDVIFDIKTHVNSTHDQYVIYVFFGHKDWSKRLGKGFYVQDIFSDRIESGS